DAVGAADQRDRGEEAIGRKERVILWSGSVRARERVGAHLVRRSSMRVPVLPAAPHPFAGSLCLRAQFREVDARDAAILYPCDAVYDHSVDVVADTAIHQALDR